jgi:holo-[acyl-carrier protein] synthase
VILGLGIDSVDIGRVEQLLTRHKDRALSRLFTADESRYACRRPQPARHLAARLAAKEAAYKALAGNALARGIGWREIEVVIAPDSPPRLQLHGLAAQRAAEMGVVKTWVSLTHSDHSAMAIVVLESD